MSDQLPTRAIRWSVTCPHAHNSVTYVLAGDSYGVLLGSTRRGERVLLDSWQDPVFEEVEDIVRSLLQRERGFSDCFQAVLGESCDPAPSGEMYDFSGRIYCPVCGTAANVYGPDDPPQIETIGLAPATHEGWQQRSTIERWDRIRRSLARVGCRATNP